MVQSLVVSVVFRPKGRCYGQGINVAIHPPCLFIATRVKIPVVKRAEGDGKLIRDLAGHGTGLGKAEVMRFGRRPPADEAGLACHEAEVRGVANAPRLGQRQNTLVDGPESRILPVAREDIGGGDMIWRGAGGGRSRRRQVWSLFPRS